MSDCDELCGLEPQECLWKVRLLFYCIPLGQLLTSTGKRRVKMVHHSGSIQSFKQQKGQWEFSPSSLWAPHPDLHLLAVMQEHPFHLYVEELRDSVKLRPHFINVLPCIGDKSDIPNRTEPQSQGGSRIHHVRTCLYVF